MCFSLLSVLGKNTGCVHVSTTVNTVIKRKVNLCNDFDYFQWEEKEVYGIVWTSF